MNPNIDHHDRKILELLQQDARVSHAEIGRRVHLSQPAVSERIKRLEVQGVIEGYRAWVDPAKLGYTITAMIRVQAQAGRPYEAFARERPEVIECLTVTGDDCLLHQAMAGNKHQIQGIIDALILA